MWFAVYSFYFLMFFCLPLHGNQREIVYLPPENKSDILKAKSHVRERDYLRPRCSLAPCYTCGCGTCVVHQPPFQCPVAVLHCVDIGVYDLSVRCFLAEQVSPEVSCFEHCGCSACRHHSICFPGMPHCAAHHRGKHPYVWLNCRIFPRHPYVVRTLWQSA